VSGFKPGLILHFYHEAWLTEALWCCAEPCKMKQLTWSWRSFQCNQLVI